LRGQIIYLRLTNARGMVKLLGHEFLADPAWQHRLVRCEVDLDHHQVRCYRLRRKEPTDQPLLATHEHRLPARRFLSPSPKTKPSRP
jgi:hypothetical protein